MKRLSYSKLSIIWGVLFLVFFLTTGSAHAAKKKSHSFPAGYCTWYVADRNDFYIAYINFRGNAKDWIANSQAKGYKTKDRGWKPKKYSVVVFNPLSSSNPEGHVALVNKVESKRFRVTEMNYKGWNKVSERWIDKNDSKIKGFVLTKKAIQEYEKDDKSEYKKLKKQYEKHDLWYDGERQ